jgi:hypothetical protein
MRCTSRDPHAEQTKRQDSPSRQREALRRSAARRTAQRRNVGKFDSGKMRERRGRLGFADRRPWAGWGAYVRDYRIR